VTTRLGFEAIACCASSASELGARKVPGTPLGNVWGSRNTATTSGIVVTDQKPRLSLVWSNGPDLPGADA
jgi:hypothetical protein